MDDGRDFPMSCCLGSSLLGGKSVFWRTERALPYAAAIISRKRLILSVVTVNRGADFNSVPDVSVFRLVWVVPCVVLTVGYFYNCLLEIHQGQMG